MKLRMKVTQTGGPAVSARKIKEHMETNNI